MLVGDLLLIQIVPTDVVFLLIEIESYSIRYDELYMIVPALVLK
jgi:hypothetical protein